MTCKYCDGPCPESKNPNRPRLFCRNACRAAWRQQERNQAIVQARDALDAVADALGVAKVQIQQFVDRLNALVIQPRKRKPSA